jgi:DNA-binding GntR family transcriptional regulator
MRNKTKRSAADNIVKLKQPQNRSQAQDQFIYHQILDAILAQRLLPGTKLTEDELAGIFEVSRAVVRRALLRLSHDCIVDIRPNRGAMVASPSVKEAREILAARRLLEATIVREAIAGATAEQLDELRTLVREEQDYFEHDERGSGIRRSGDFHLRLAQVSGNATLTKFIRELIPRTSLIITQYEKPGNSTCSHAEHFELIDVIAAGDSERAVRLMDEHLQHIENKLDLADENASSDLRQIFAGVIKPKEQQP